LYALVFFIVGYANILSFYEKAENAGKMCKNVAGMKIIIYICGKVL